MTTCPSIVSANWKLKPNLKRLADVGDAAGETEAPAVAAAKATAADEMLDLLLEDLCDVTTTPGAGDGGEEFGLLLKVGERRASRGEVLPKSQLFRSRISVLPGLKRVIGLLGVCGDLLPGVRGGVSGDVLGEVLGDTVGGLGERTASKTVSYRPPGFLLIVMLCSQVWPVLLGVPITSGLTLLEFESRELALSQENSLQKPLKPSGGELEIGLVAGVTVTPTVLIMFSESLYCMSMDVLSITVSFDSDCSYMSLTTTSADEPFLFESRFFIFGGESNFSTGTFSASASCTLVKADVFGMSFWLKLSVS